MDPLAHTLVGAALAQTSLARQGGRKLSLATPTLLLGANLPDVDALLYLVSGDLALTWRRGWTHGVLAMAVLPVVLTAAVLGWDRWVRRRRHPESTRASPGALLALAYLAFLTHPALDWLNTYGIRLLMPFDGRWFYGDSLVIIDPWLWLSLGGAVFLARTTSGEIRSAERVLWIAVAALTSLLVLRAPMPEGIDPTVPRWIWCLGLAAIAILAWRGRRGEGARGWHRRLVPGALTAVGVYILLTVIGTGIARDRVLAELGRRGIAVEDPSRDLMVGPLPFDPLVRDVVVRTSDRYRIGRFHWLPDPGLDLTGEIPLVSPPGSLPPAVLQTVEGASCIRGFLGWVRFPWIEVERADEGGGSGTVVHLLDARYVRRRTTRFGGATVRVGEDGSARCP